MHDASKQLALRILCWAVCPGDLRALCCAANKSSYRRLREICDANHIHVVIFVKSIGIVRMSPKKLASES